MQNKRPVFLNLLQIRMPITAVVSISHRISGVLMVLSIPFCLAALQLSLTPEGYARLGELLGHPALRLALLVPIWAVAQHLLAGVRFLIIDLEMGVEKSLARRGAWLVQMGTAGLTGLAALGMILL